MLIMIGLFQDFPAGTGLLKEFEERIFGLLLLLIEAGVLFFVVSSVYCTY